MRRYQCFLLLALLSSLAACRHEASQSTVAPTPTAPFQTKASIREIMDAELDPAADGLWNSVAIVSGEKKQPQTPEEWLAVRRHAITLIEATNLIVMDGRRIAPAGSSYPGEADTAVLQSRLDANRAGFASMAQAARAVGVKMLDAVDAKDAKRLFDLGGDLDKACEACHVVYWYPPDLKTKS